MAQVSETCSCGAQFTCVMTANIRPKVQPHSDCWRQEWMKLGFLGDVRRCIHGRVQVLTEVPSYSRVKGPGTHWWRTLSPIFSPFTYRRAKRALEPAPPKANQCGKAYGKGRNGVYECERPKGHDGKHWTVTPPEQIPSTLTRIQGGKP